MIVRLETAGARRVRGCCCARRSTSVAVAARRRAAHAGRGPLGCIRPSVTLLLGVNVNNGALASHRRVVTAHKVLNATATLLLARYRLGLSSGAILAPRDEGFTVLQGSVGAGEGRDGLLAASTAAAYNGIRELRRRLVEDGSLPLYGSRATVNLDVVFAHPRRTAPLSPDGAAARSYRMGHRHKADFRAGGAARPRRRTGRRKRRAAVPAGAVASRQIRESGDVT